MPEHVKSSSDGLCMKCPAAAKWLAVLVIVVCLAGLLLYLFVISKRSVCVDVFAHMLLASLLCLVLFYNCCCSVCCLCVTLTRQVDVCADLCIPIQPTTNKLSISLFFLQMSALLENSLAFFCCSPTSLGQSRFFLVRLAP